MSAGKGVEKREALCTVVGMWAGTYTMESSMEVPQKSKSGTAPYQPAVPLLDIYLKKMKTLIQKTNLQSHVHCSIAYDSEDMATA